MFYEVPIATIVQLLVEALAASLLTGWCVHRARRGPAAAAAALCGIAWAGVVWTWFAAYASARSLDSVRLLVWTGEHHLALGWIRTIGLAGVVAAAVVVGRRRS